MTDGSVEQGLEHHLHTTGIHEFVFHESSHRIVDVWLSHTTAIAKTTPSTTIVRYLLVYSSKDMLPLMHVFSRLQKLIREMPDRHYTRVAVMHQPNFMVSIAQLFIKALGTGDKDRVRFFSLDDREAAVAWLLRDD